MRPDFFEAFLSFGMHFSHVSGKLLKLCKPESLTPKQFEILRIIEADKQITLSDLCGCAEIAMPNGSREVKKLSDMGLLQKIDDANDKRIQGISLSEAGVEMMNQAYGKLMAIAIEQYKHLDASEIDEMTTCFLTLNRLL